MPLVVEDGSGLADAVSYVSLAEANAYHLARRNEAWLSPDAADEMHEAALIRATAFIDARYRNRFPGYRLRLRAQALEWPRLNAYVEMPSTALSASSYAADWSSTLIPSNEVPREIKAAVCEAALRELAEPGSLAPDIERLPQSLSAGSVSITYAAGASAKTMFQAIDLALASLLMPSTAFSGKVSRG